MTLKEACRELSISVATGKNWVRLGKLIPTENRGGIPLFSVDYIEQIKKAITSGENTALKSRRNKKYVSGIGLYNSYVSDSCRLQKKSLLELIEVLAEKELELTQQEVSYLVADCAVSLFADKFGITWDEGLYKRYLRKEVSFGERDQLLDDLIGDRKRALLFYEKEPELFGRQYAYEEKEDIPGLIYISCKNLGNRKAKGSYYTPNLVVKKLMEQLGEVGDKKVFDPCCGTGNFLLQLPKEVGIQKIFGNDIDEVSIRIARINMALKFDRASAEVIKKHFTSVDYLSESFDKKFDLVIGNPPWGYDFSDEERASLKGRYRVTEKKSFESYDVFVEKALRELPVGGLLSFVLPEAILGVKGHRPIREFILEESTLDRIVYLGDAFDKVNCPSVILRICKTGKKMSVKGLKVSDEDREFTIETDREADADSFNFLATDEEYRILKKLEMTDNIRYLRENADFALGIVTGNNRDYIFSKKNSENEVILKGSDISRYRAGSGENYIVFKPENFQQVAREEYYRAKEKLFYKFISSYPVFAYDDKGRLSLNSCNIVIPRIEGLTVKYVLAVLNSTVSRFIFLRRFNSVKILRAHIEAIPIPYADEKTQKVVSELADRLIYADGRKASNDWNLQDEEIYEKIDDIIMDLFDLDPKERTIISNNTRG
ncbi:MAG: N-6 DNA methylase [Butyrivibrio sp.]|nr:N-6 DNA methylase [Butyrivibrio sp.]